MEDTVFQQKQFQYKPFYWVLIFISILFEADFLFAQQFLPNRDGFYPITHKYIPEKWELFDFRINPYSPVYETEVSIPDSSYIFIEIYRLAENDEKKLVNSTFTSGTFRSKPGVYSINWVKISDDNDLPAIDGEYEVTLKAYQDSLKQQLLFSDTTERFWVSMGWKKLDSKIVLDHIQTFPGYYVPNDLSLRNRKEDTEKGRNWSLLGARVNISDQDWENHSISLSFKFEPNEYNRAFSSFFDVSLDQDLEQPFIVNERLSFNSIEQVEFRIYEGKLELLAIQHFQSDLVVLDLTKLWETLSE